MPITPCLSLHAYHSMLITPCLSLHAYHSMPITACSEAAFPPQGVNLLGVDFDDANLNKVHHNSIQ